METVIYLFWRILTYPLVVLYSMVFSGFPFVDLPVGNEEYNNG